MTELLSGVDAPSDAELISRVRGGDVAAYGELFARHVEAARRLGRQLVRGTDIDDLVSDAFAKVLHVLQNGGGPDVAFRAYLLTSVRRLHIDRIRATSKVQPSDDMAQFDNGIPFQDTAVASFENGAAAKAFASLPERWQMVLWHLEVEDQKPADIALLLGMTPNSVSALAYRAREGLRQAFLTMHLADNAGDDCRWVTERLGAYVRKGLARRDTTKVSSHLDECRRCTAMYLELTEVNSNLAGIIAPLLLGAAAAGYASSGSAAGLTGVSAVLGRVRDVVTSNAGGGAAAGAGSAVTSGGLITAGAIAAGVAAVTSAALVFGGGGAKDVLIEADQPLRVVQTPSGTAPPERTSPETDAAAPQDVSEALGDDTGDISGAADSGDTTVTGAGTDDVVGAEADVVQPVGFTPASPAPGPEPGVVTGPGAPAPASPGADQPGPAAPGADRPGSDGPGTDPGTDTPGTDPSPGTPPAEPGTGSPAPGPGGPADEPGTDSPPSGDPGTPPPVHSPGTDAPGTDPGTGGDTAGEPGGTPDPRDTGNDGQHRDDETSVVETQLSVTGADVVEGDLVFSLHGDPVLPAAFTVELTSAPDGIVFAAGGTCTLMLDTLVTCSTTVAPLAAGVGGMPMVAHASGTHEGRIPLEITPGRGETELSMTVTSADAGVVAGASGFTFRYVAPGNDAPDVEEPKHILFGPVKEEKPHWVTSVTLTEALAGDAVPEFTLTGAGVEHARIKETAELSPGTYQVTIHMPPGQGQESVTLQVSVGQHTATSSFTVGEPLPVVTEDGDADHSPQAHKKLQR